MTKFSGEVGVVETPFPTGALVPKAETGVVTFLQKYPEFDGRDVTIAILDSGVDPRATGLETLCDGKTVKVIERFDCTGCGDVNATKKVKPDDKGYITGLSGRQLKLTSEMIANNTAANGEFRLGLKRFYDLCPSKVRENLTNARKLKEWDGPHKTAIAEISRKINEFDAQNPDTSKLSWDKKLIKEDLDNTLDMLNAYEKYYPDIKTAFDCILYETQNGWQAVIDISEKGDLEKALHIGEYIKTHEIKNVDDYLSISVNVHDEGDVLEIVGMCSSHGTHVASIASGNHASNDLNGVAPNAKIVSLTIGDGRLGSMETGTGLVRAVMKIMELCRTGRKVDVINMSYGEHSHWSNCGRIGELMSEVVNKYGVVWVASAGNHGPALCTVGTPPDIAQPSCIGVGAYVSPQMMEAEYALREKLPANCYTWTSRDPCIDGGQGVTVCAPGGAITSVPQFTMSKSVLMNGTSMAAPHVAGAIALLISGLKQRKVAYSPFSIKRAICATATKLGYVDPFAQGSGLLNVEKAFEHLMEHDKAAENMLRFSVRCGPNNAKGIHIREGVLKKPYEFNVNIEPVFFNDTEAAPKDKFNFNVRLNLISSQPFVQCGQFLDLCYSTRSLAVKVDPSGLPAGVHRAVIRAFDTSCVQKGSLFEIPVTVVQPHRIDWQESRLYQPTTQNADGSIEFQPNTIQREFILVPPRATWAVLRMRSTDKNRDKDVGKFFVHTVQLLPKSSCRVLETMKILSVNSENETTLAFKCQENNILEVCIAKYWSNFGSSHLKYSLEFHGIQANSSYVMHGARGVHSMEITSLVSEELQPVVQFKTAAVVLKPSESKISPLSATRDVIPEGRQIYQNLLTYSLNVAKAMEVALYAPIFNSVLYEAEYESQLWMIFDANKHMVACGDANSHKFYTKLDKGEYCIRLQIRHEKRDVLEKINEANMIALFKLPSSLNLEVYDQYNQCVIAGKKFNYSTVKQDCPKVLYVAPLGQEKLAKASLPSATAWLSGSITLAKDEVGRKVDVQEFVYVLNPPDGGKKNGGGNGSASSANSSSSSSSSSNAAASSSKSKAGATAGPSSATPTNGGNGDGGASASPKKSKSSTDEYAESLRDFQCSMLNKLDLEKAEKIYEDIIAGHPKHLAAHLLLIQNIESSSELKAQYPFTFAKSLNATNSKHQHTQHSPSSDGHNAVASGSSAAAGGPEDSTSSSSGSSTTTTTTTATEDKQKEDNQKLRNALERIVLLADNVIRDTDKDALLAYYGIKCDTRPDAAKIKTQMDNQKKNLLEALGKKGIAVAKLCVLDNNVKDRLEDIDNIYTEIIKFVDASDSKVIQFSLWHAHVHEQYGRMYKYLQKLCDEKRNRENFEELYLIAGALKYDHLQTVVQRLTVSTFPQTYRLF
ncbi:tripeptidyl-peptidase 2 [Stomoxys calcitrans]|uniref:tripeptidyl-peptidase 2 n=1 Tax=Stomoxys calcitrans TaxID=35570 RepID=UPI0027E26515|nr:tripeptidyl-peptidase 2 [Stomoxys calcitrans]